MSKILMALALGAISMIVVLISGLSSGVVRIWTLAFRCCLAFCITGGFCYFLLIFVEMYYERLQKEKEQVENELAEGEENSQSEENNKVASTNE